MTVFLIVIVVTVAALTLAVRISACDGGPRQRYAPRFDEWSPDVPSRPYASNGLARPRS